MSSKSEILPEIEALSVHCRPPLMEASQRTSWLMDWCADMAEYPIEAIRIACRKWRLSGSTKFPTPGQLLPLVRENLPSQSSTEKYLPWRPASQEEYQAMTVREKIRERLILAHEAFCKAGPMFRNQSSGSMARAAGKHLTEDQMTPAYRAHRDEGRAHMAEVARLRKYISTDIVVAAE